MQNKLNIRLILLLMTAFMAMSILVGCGSKEPPPPEITPELLRADRSFLRGDTEQGFEKLQAMIDADPNSFYGYYHLGFFHLMNRNPDLGKEALAKAAEIYPDHPGPHYFMGLADYGGGLGTGVPEPMMTGLRLSEERWGLALPDTAAQARKAWQLIWKKKPRDAQGIMTGLVNNDPDNPKMLFLQAYAMYMRGNNLAALEPLFRSIELDPTFASAQALLGACQYNTSKRAEAKTTCLKALELDPTQALALHIYGQLLSEASEYTDAFNHMLLSVLEDPTVPFYYEYLGSTLIRFGYNDLGSEILSAMERTNSFLGNHFEWPGYVPQN